MSHTTQENQKTGMLRHLRLMVLVLGFVFVLLFVLSWNISAETGAPSHNGATTDVWIIEAGDHVLRENEELSLGGNVLIEEGGSLTFSNTSIVFQDKDGGNPRYHYLSLQGGTLKITNGSEIHAPWEGGLGYGPYPSGRCMIENSSINDIIIIMGYGLDIRNSSMTNITSISFMFGNSNITNNHMEFKDEYHDGNDFRLWAIRISESGSFQNNTIVSKRYTFFQWSSGITVINNTFINKKESDLSLGIQDSQDIKVSNNTFEFNGTNGIQVINSFNLTFSYNTFRPLMDGLVIGNGIDIQAESHNVAIFNNSFLFSTIGVHIGGGSYSCSVYNNTFDHNSHFGITYDNFSYGILISDDASECTVFGNFVNDSKTGIFVSDAQSILVFNNSIQNVQYGIMTRRSHSMEIRNNTVIDSEFGATILLHSNSISIHNNIFTNLTYGVAIANMSYANEIYQNQFTNLTRVLYERNNAPTEEHDNSYENVSYLYWRETEFFCFVLDQKGSPIEHVNVTIIDSQDDIVFRGSTDVNGTIPWMVLTNVTVTSNQTTYFSPYTLILEFLGKQDRIPFVLQHNSSTTITSRLDIITDVLVDVLQFGDKYERGSEVPIDINLTMVHDGHVNFSMSQVWIDVVFEDKEYQLYNQTFDDVFIGLNIPINLSWFIVKETELGEYHLEIEMVCYSQYLADPFIERNSIPFDIINSPPSIDPNFLSDNNFTVNKNVNVDMDFSNYLYDYEDDLTNLSISVFQLNTVKEAIISDTKKTVTVEPHYSYSGSTWIIVTITDMDGSQFDLIVNLTWVNHAPVFLPRESFTWITQQRTLTLDLAELAADEDINEILSWNYSNEDHDKGDLDINLVEHSLSITQAAYHLTSTEINLTVSDASNARSSQIITIIWEANVFLSNIELSYENEIAFQEDLVDIMVSIRSSTDVLATIDLFFYLDTMDSPVRQWEREIDDQITEQISIPWSAVGGNHEIIISLVVTSPLDRNLTDHKLQLPIIVYFPMTMICDSNSNIPLELVEEGNSLQVEVFTPPAKGIKHVTIKIMNLSYNGAIQNLGQDSFEVGEGGGTELIQGITIFVTPLEQNIDPGSSGLFAITITIDEDANYTNNDVLELCLYAEGDDGRSNYVVLHAMVKVESEKSASQFPLFSHSTVILIIGIFILPLVAVKVSSALGNSFYSMYKLSRFIFLAFPRLFSFLCPLYAKQNEDDEALHNEYRDKICEFLYARGEQGGTTQDIMKFLKMWFPYGTTGDANPENNNVTGVVRLHIDVLKKKKYIKELGGRYYYRSYKPSLPEEIYDPDINWNSLLHDGTTKLKNATICKMISAIYSRGEEGMRNKEIAKIMDMTPYAVYYHMKNLENAKLIEKRRGMGKRYFINAIVMAPFLNGNV